MIVTLSPARLMDFATPSAIRKESNVLFEKEAEMLIDELQNFSVNELAGLMNINPQLAIETYQYIQAFHVDKTPAKQAVLTYNGIAYQGLDFASFSDSDIEYAQNHLLILSGLYGALCPLDMIKPYRLEMQIRLENEKGKSLYDFWTEKLTSYLSERLNKDDNVWVNLMSNEFTKVIDKKSLPKVIQVITPVFKQQSAKGYKQVVVYTKKARGMMARFILKNRIADIEQLKAFDEEGYSFSPHLSKGGEWVFVR